MEYIPINDSKLKIICEEEDLALYGLSVDSLEYGDECGKRFIEEILDKAQRTLGFESKHYRLLIQLFPSLDGGCEIFISRLDLLSKESLCPSEQTNNKAEISPCKRLFFFERLDPLLEVCKRLSLIDQKIKGDALYLEGKGYYLIVELNSNILEEYGIFSLDEFSFIFEYGVAEDFLTRSPYLYEHAKAICRNNAIQLLGKL